MHPAAVKVKVYGTGGGVGVVELGRLGGIDPVHCAPGPVHGTAMLVLLAKFWIAGETLRLQFEPPSVFHFNVICPAVLRSDEG